MFFVPNFDSSVTFIHWLLFLYTSTSSLTLNTLHKGEAYPKNIKDIFDGQIWQYFAVSHSILSMHLLEKPFPNSSYIYLILRGSDCYYNFYIIFQLKKKLNVVESIICVTQILHKKPYNTPVSINQSLLPFYPSKCRSFHLVSLERQSRTNILNTCVRSSCSIVLSALKLYG